ncbi:hypothetical protein EDC01DRAFT_778064 [Geopyxis carbonaria]|nr:hypothetical protein EDC01DRAFT_778064 [Geopyxis carbonaria]
MCNYLTIYYKFCAHASSATEDLYFDSHCDASLDSSGPECTERATVGTKKLDLMCLQCTPAMRGWNYDHEDEPIVDPEPLIDGTDAPMAEPILDDEEFLARKRKNVILKDIVAHNGDKRLSAELETEAETEPEFRSKSLTQSEVVATSGFASINPSPTISKIDIVKQDPAKSKENELMKSPNKRKKPQKEEKAPPGTTRDDGQVSKRRKTSGEVPLMPLESDTSNDNPKPSPESRPKRERAATQKVSPTLVIKPKKTKRKTKPTKTPKTPSPKKPSPTTPPPRVNSLSVSPDPSLLPDDFHTRPATSIPASPQLPKKLPFPKDASETHYLYSPVWHELFCQWWYSTSGYAEYMKRVKEGRAYKLWHWGMVMPSPNWAFFEQGTDMEGNMGVMCSRCRSWLAHPAKTKNVGTLGGHLRACEKARAKKESKEKGFAVILEEGEHGCEEGVDSVEI